RPCKISQCDYAHPTPHSRLPTPDTMNPEIEQLLADNTAYCKKAEISESTFGRQVVNDGKIVNRLRSGRGVTLKTLMRTREYIRNHPPGPDAISDKEAALKLVDEQLSQPAA